FLSRVNSTMLCGASQDCRCNSAVRARNTAAVHVEAREDGMMQSKVLLGKLLVGLVFFNAALVAARATSADEEKATATKEPWKPGDFIYGETAGQFRILPGGK